MSIEPTSLSVRQPRPGQKPTAAQRRALLEAIENGGRIQLHVGASASRLRANLLRACWTNGMEVTDAGYAAVGRTRREDQP